MLKLIRQRVTNDNTFENIITIIIIKGNRCNKINRANENKRKLIAEQIHRLIGSRSATKMLKTHQIQSKELIKYGIVNLLIIVHKNIHE